MVEVGELFDSQTPMEGDLQAGLKTISHTQTISFMLYGRVVLPVDGFVFWVRADLLSKQALAGIVTATQLAAIEEMANRLPGVSVDASNPYIIEARGSLHYAADIRQEEIETYAANRIVLTTTDEVKAFNDIAPGTMWIGQFGSMRFSFSIISSRYRQAGLWHYSGFAIYPDIEPNIIDDISQFSQASVVSNSLPLWLNLANYKPQWAFWNPPPPLFVGFLAPANQPPPFAAIHVVPDSTFALAMSPTIDHKTSTHIQLCSERVRVTLWGMRNDQALDFVDMVNRYTLDTDTFGIMNMPVVRDAIRTQSELGVIAMKKTIEWEVSYLQQRVNTIATQIIKSAIPTFIIGT